MVGDVDESASESFPDIRGNDDFRAGYSVSFGFNLFIHLLYLFCCRLVMWMQSGIVGPSNPESLMVAPLSLMDRKCSSGRGTSLTEVVLRKVNFEV